MCGTTRTRGFQHHSFRKGENPLLQPRVVPEKNMPLQVSLLKIIITPMAKAESERSFSTLKRTETFTRNTMGQQRFNALDLLPIEK